MNQKPLDGLSILVLEDEFLIAMDVEQLCIEYGAREVTIGRDLDSLGPEPLRDVRFDAAILDMRLGGTSTLDFGSTLLAAGRPFVFATGYADSAELSGSFPGVEIIGKPYNGADLISALERAITRSATRVAS